MLRPQFRLRSLFIVTAIVAVVCMGIVNAKNHGLNPIEGAVIGVLAVLLIASRWPRVWFDRRIYDRWPKTGVFPPLNDGPATSQQSDNDAQQTGMPAAPPPASPPTE